MSEKVEIWKDIPNYEGLYQVSNFGNIKSLSRIVIRGMNNCENLLCEKLLNPTILKQGYYAVCLYNNGKKTIKNHTLVASAFLEKPKNVKYLTINHKDLNKLNNIVDNLEYISSRENTKHYRLSVKHSSKYVGVSFYKQTNKWRARIEINKKAIHLGYYVNEKDALNLYEYVLNNFNNSKLTTEEIKEKIKHYKDQTKTIQLKRIDFFEQTEQDKISNQF